jgi:hypothetical protein
LVSVEACQKEWRLLEEFVLLAGKLAEHRSLDSLKPEIEAADALLRQLREHDLGDSRRTAKKFGIRIEDIPPSEQNDEACQDSTMDMHVPSESDKERWRLNNLVTSAFDRALPRLQTHFEYAATGQPSFRVETTSTLGIAYFGLLRNFSRGWKRCERSDCGSVFRVTDDKRKIFCSQYCGHLVSLRQKRAAKGKRKLRVQNKLRRGAR